jgi:RNA polymerase sigma-70 factor (sigma-E family)
MSHPSAGPAVPATVEFGDYVRERRTALLRAARAISTDPDLAEDLLQTVLGKVGSRWGAIRNHGAADAYVRRAMVNQQASWYREKWRNLEVVTSHPPEPAPDEPSALPGPGHDRGDLQLWPLVAALPPGQRSAVALRYYEGLTEAETARALGCSIGTVKSNTSRGLAALRRRAEETGYADLVG